MTDINQSLEYNYENEEAIWRKFYLTFNDDNEYHCMYSFHNQGFQTATDIHVGNLAWIKEVLSHGHSLEEILEDIPEARELIAEYEDDNESKISLENKITEAHEKCIQNAMQSKSVRSEFIRE